jgi:hypothetical protein
MQEESNFSSNEEDKINAYTLSSAFSGECIVVLEGVADYDLWI